MLSPPSVYHLVLVYVCMHVCVCVCAHRGQIVTDRASEVNVLNQSF